MALCYCAHDPQYIKFFSQNDIVKYVENVFYMFYSFHIAKRISSRSYIISK